MEKIEDIIVMKVGPHSDMSLEEIIESKKSNTKRQVIENFDEEVLKRLKDIEKS